MQRGNTAYVKAHYQKYCRPSAQLSYLLKYMSKNTHKDKQTKNKQQQHIFKASFGACVDV